MNRLFGAAILLCVGAVPASAQDPPPGAVTHEFESWALFTPLPIDPLLGYVTDARSVVAPYVTVSAGLEPLEIAGGEMWTNEFGAHLDWTFAAPVRYFSADVFTEDPTSMIFSFFLNGTKVGGAEVDVGSGVFITYTNPGVLYDLVTIEDASSIFVGLGSLTHGMATPEPAAGLLLGTGLLAIWAFASVSRRRRTKPS